MNMNVAKHQTASTKLVVVSISILLVLGVEGFTADREPVRFGVCSDVHKDVMHDADRRLGVFVERMNRDKVDFIIQLGDFCRPIAANDGFLEIWNTFDGPRYHVLGNHDMDGGSTRDQTVAYWDMPARYYAFNASGYRFIVLDGNDKTTPPQPGYARYIGAEQQEWLRRDLAGTRLPTIIFSHQSLEAEGGIANGEAVRAILEEANRAVESGKVLACFSGHHHMDYCRQINGIQYIQINSMSYFWVGGDYQHVRYNPEIDRDYPWIKYTAPYEEPVYALVTLAPDGTIHIEGTQTRWVGPSPWDLGYPQDQKERITPGISTRQVETILKQQSVLLD